MTLNPGTSPPLPLPNSMLPSLWDRIRSKLGRGGKLTKSSIGALFVFGTSAGLAYVTQLAIARTIGADGFGVFAYAMAWTTLLAYVSTLGFHVSLLRFLSAYRATGDWQLARGVLRYSQQRVALAGVGAGLAGIAVVVCLGTRLSPELSTALLFGFASVPVVAMHLLTASAVRAFGGVMTAVVPERIVRDCVLVSLVLAGSSTTIVPADGRLAMAAALAGAVSTLVLLRWFMRRLRPAELETATAKKRPVEWWKPMLPLTAIMIADNAMCRSGIIALGLANGTREAGLFAIAYSIALLTTLPRMAVATVFAPSVSALHARGDSAAMQKLSSNAALLSLLGTIGVSSALLAVCEPVLAFFGRDFVASVPLVWVLVLGHLFSAACGPQQHLITMTANEKAGAQIFAAAAVINVAGCALLILPFGTMGVAIAMSVSVVAWNVAMAAYIHRSLNLKPGLLAILSFGSRRGRILSE